MLINHPMTAFQGVAPENVFFVSNDQHVQMGYGYVVQFFQNEACPERPQRLFLYMEVQESARCLLYGALLARAEQLRNEAPMIPARLYTELKPSEIDMQRFYEKMGFKKDDGEEVYRFSVVPGRAQAPMSMQYASVPLDTLEQEDNLLLRLNAYRIRPFDRDYLTLWRQQPNFMVLAFYRDGIPVCEAVFTGADGQATLIDVHTLPQYRRQGLATQLLGAACVHLQERGVREIYTHVFKGNPAQMGLMRKLNGQFVRTLYLLPGLNM